MLNRMGYDAVAQRFAGQIILVGHGYLIQRVASGEGSALQDVGLEADDDFPIIPVFITRDPPAGIRM